MIKIPGSQIPEHKVGRSPNMRRNESDGEFFKGEINENPHKNMTLFRFVEDFEHFGEQDMRWYCFLSDFVEDFGFPGYALVMLSDA